MSVTQISFSYDDNLYPYDVMEAVNEALEEDGRNFRFESVDDDDEYHDTYSLVRKK